MRHFLRSSPVALLTSGVGMTAAQIEALFARLAALAAQAERTDGAPVRRAVHNLRAAVMERLGREGAGADLPFEVARIIDEATQRIERL